jgi:hypothetical protein
MRYRTPVRSLDQRSDQRGLVDFARLDGAPIVVTARQIASLRSVMLIGVRPLDVEPSWGRKSRWRRMLAAERGRQSARA